MAIQDISNLAIEDSFQHLTQYDTSSKAIGTALGATISEIAVTASFATTASHALNVPATASHALTAVSASFATSASVADRATDAGFAASANSANIATSASYALSASVAVSAQTAITATSAGSATTATTALSASFAENSRNATSASFAQDARTADSADTATSASYALVAGSVEGNIESASVAISASFASTSSLALRNILTATNDFSEITFTNGDGTTSILDTTPRQVIESVKNADSITLAKGFPVYVSGSTGNALNVYRADASNPTRMPATFVLEQTLDPGEEGTGILSGFINGVSTVGFNDGDEVWVAVGGGYTNVKPTGSALVQRLGNVVIGNSANGSGVISTQQFNDLPNIASGHAWVGNINQVPTAVSTASLLVDNAVSASRAVTASNADSLKEGIDVVLNSGSFQFISAASASFGYISSITGSAKIIGDAFVQVNTDTPALRYGGLQVVDTGSLNSTASFQWDGEKDIWMQVEVDGTSAGFLTGMSGSLGNEIFPANNTIVKGTGTHQVTDSSITDDGSSVVIGNVTTFTNGASGSLHGNVTGNLTGNADTATSASFATNANSSLTAVSASFATTATTAGFATSASFAEDARTADSSTSASFAESSSVAVSASFSEDARTADSATSASFASTISRTLVQDLTIDGAVNGVVNSISIVSDTASIDMSAGNFFTLALPAGGAVHITATNKQAGQTINLQTTQNATAATLDFNSEFKFESGSLFAASTGSGAIDLMSFVSFDTSNVLGTGINNLV
jgi:hypothetical protein